MSTEGRQRALETTLAGLHKRFGDGVVMKLGDAANLRVEAIPTGSLSLDIALGVGGIPRGRIVEIYGPESSGKTTLCLHAIAEAQKLGGICGFVDVEHALDPTYASRIGVNIDELYVSQPDAGEQVIQKSYPNSFRGTALLEEVQKAELERLVICGAMSHMCIDATTRAAFDLGYTCVLIEDACATRDLEFGGQTIAARQVHGAFMAALGSAYANVLTRKDFMSGL